ncbi:cytochrome c [Carboxylicivirga sediminis]|uniref:Cytochrome c n=1 Tax=Carboxylicivirga sediminis TaxID=2006564 RepID=A0A941IW97_9BACT|nr:cytochrome c [Carboxylicivirga sediminis]MBR8534239.1 cytochrome c [Carboxylicivirga sediminis]
MQKLAVLVLAILFVACNSSSNKKEQSQEVKAVEKTQHPGEIQYKRHCLSCHQKNAGGIPGMYPPLADNKVVSGEKEPLINIVLHGLSGEIEVNGEKYNGVMASYKNLSDKDIADVLNYLRSGFGNSGEAITPAEVKSLR